MKELGSSPQIDPLLTPFLQAVDNEEQECLERLLTGVADLLKKITTNEDEHQEAQRQLIVALRKCKADPENNSIRNFTHYTASVAKHVRLGQRRVERPEFTALKDELRRSLRAEARFALWKSETGNQVCGLAEWSGQSSLPTRSERLARLSHDPLGCEDEVLEERN